MDDLESMALCAIRYCIGRRSYIVGAGIKWAREFGTSSPHVRRVLIHDLDDAVATIERSDGKAETLGMKSDEREWRALLAELKEIEARS